MMWLTRLRQKPTGGGTFTSGELLWPLGLGGPEAPADLPQSVRAVYNEARAVTNTSPRSAAALLRVTLEGILTELFPDQGNLNATIGAAAQAGLPTQVIQAMDVLRFNGNQSAHALSHEDTPETVTALFKILVLVVERLISEPRQIAEMHALLPEGVRQQIEHRDTSKG